MWLWHAAWQEDSAAGVIPLPFVSDRRLCSSFCKVRFYIVRKSSLPIATPLWRRII
jgi:hypothetical protein